MSNPFRSGAAKWSSTALHVSDEPVPVSPRRGPSLLFALTVIVAVAGATAGAVAMFFVEPSESAPDATQAVAATAPAEPDAVAPAAPAVPVHKVTTQTVKAQADVSADKQGKVQAVDTASADDDELNQQDPRWARSGSEKTATVFASVLQSPSGAADKPAAEDKTATENGALALAEESPSEAVDQADETRTAALAPDDVKPKQTAKQAAKPEQPEEKTKQAAVDDEVQDTAPVTGTTQVIKGANMRSRPKSGSRVLGTVPKGATVQLVGCDSWCEIVYKGRRGYVYKDFVAGGRSAKAAASGKVKSSFTVSTSEPEADQPKQDDKTAAAAGSKADEKPKGIISPRAQ